MNGLRVAVYALVYCLVWAVAICAVGIPLFFIVHTTERLFFGP